MDRVFMKGNDVIAEAAIRSGCKCYFGYPITPQNDIPEYLSRNLIQAGGVFLQAESEVASINMVMGAAATGARVMTSSSSPGISLMQEGISYLAGCELPCVIVNMMRGGPGLGGIGATQSDYFQATKGGGHGDYNLVVLAPGSGQELGDLTVLAFDLADRYRTPVMILGDGVLGQMMEAVQLPEPQNNQPEKPWATVGCAGRGKNTITSLYLVERDLYEHNKRLQKKFNAIKENEQRFESYFCEDAELVLTAFGTAARIGRETVDICRSEGLKVGLFRPVTLWPFPEQGLTEHTKYAQNILTIELNAGQMVEDVKLYAPKHISVRFLGTMGGIMPRVQEICDRIKEIVLE